MELSYWVLCIFHTTKNSVKHQTPSRKNETVLSQEVYLKNHLHFNITLIEKNSSLNAVKRNYFLQEERLKITYILILY